MTYGNLPFKEKNTKHICNGELVASTAKRVFSSAIDYLTPGALFVIDRTGVLDGSSSLDYFSIPELFFLAVINSIVVQGFTGFSLGRWVTGSTLLRPVGRSGFERPGGRIVLRFAPHLLICFLLVNAPPGTPCDESYVHCGRSNDVLWWPILIAGLFSLVVWELDPLLRTPWDKWSKMVVVDRRMRPVDFHRPEKNIR